MANFIKVTLNYVKCSSNDMSLIYRFDTFFLTNERTRFIFIVLIEVFYCVIRIEETELVCAISEKVIWVCKNIFWGHKRVLNGS